MTKQDLQKELLEKVKEGVKPSDLKKKKVKPKTDEGYSSEKEKNIPTPPIAPNQKIKDLETQINSLQKQLQTYKDFKEADLKIKERYKKEIEEYKGKVNNLEAKISEQYKTIEDLKKQVKNKGEVKEPIKLFTCSQCSQIKPLPELSRVFSNFSFCRSCSIKAKQTAETETKNPIICQICQQPSKEIYKAHVNNYSNIDPRTITNCCRDCWLNKIIPEPTINYCPYLGEGYQGWELRPRYDCNCEIKT